MSSDFHSAAARAADSQWTRLAQRADALESALIALFGDQPQGHLRAWVSGGAVTVSLSSDEALAVGMLIGDAALAKRHEAQVRKAANAVEFDEAMFAQLLDEASAYTDAEWRALEGMSGVLEGFDPECTIRRANPLHEVCINRDGAPVRPGQSCWTNARRQILDAPTLTKGDLDDLARYQADEHLLAHSPDATFDEWYGRTDDGEESLVADDIAAERAFFQSEVE